MAQVPRQGEALEPPRNPWPLPRGQGRSPGGEAVVFPNHPQFSLASTDTRSRECRGHMATGEYRGRTTVVYRAVQRLARLVPASLAGRRYHAEAAVQRAEYLAALGRDQHRVLDLQSGEAQLVVR